MEGSKGSYGRTNLRKAKMKEGSLSFIEVDEDAERRVAVL